MHKKLNLKRKNRQTNSKQKISNKGMRRTLFPHELKNRSFHFQQLVVMPRALLSLLLFYWSKILLLLLQLLLLLRSDVAQDVLPAHTHTEFRGDSDEDHQWFSTPQKPLRRLRSAPYNFTFIQYIEYEWKIKRDGFFLPLRSFATLTKD